MDPHEAVHQARLAAASPKRATAADLPQLIALMTSAFEDDPVMGWGFRGGSRHGEAVRRYMDYAIGEQSSRHDQMYLSVDAAAGIVWLPPSGIASLKAPKGSTLKLLPRMLRISGLRRLPRLVALGEAVERHHPPAPPHWYLYFLGVSPALRGKGLGSSILQATLAQVDDEGSAAYLDNSKEQNIRLYERHGFRIISEYRARKDAPPIWGMWRDGRKSSPA